MQEAVTGAVAPGVPDFQAAIKRCVPLGCVFRGVPHQHRHADGSALAAALLADTQVGCGCGATRGDQARSMEAALVHRFARLSSWHRKQTLLS